jgi:large conductance mechanosensitive channel
VEGFRKFILRGNVVDLAVAVVVGAAFGAVIKAFTEGVITPLIGVFGGIPDFSAWSFTINNSVFPIGTFINALLTFLITAAIVYFFVVLPLNKMMDRFKPEEDVTAPKRECPECLSKIPVDARRCAFCTAVVAPEPVGTPS